MGIPFDPTLGPSFKDIVKVLEIVIIMVLTIAQPQITTKSGRLVKPPKKMNL